MKLVLCFLLCPHAVWCFAEFTIRTGITVTVQSTGFMFKGLAMTLRLASKTPERSAQEHPSIPTDILEDASLPPDYNHPRWSELLQDVRDTLNHIHARDVQAAPFLRVLVLGLNQALTYAERGQQECLTPALIMAQNDIKHAHILSQETLHHARARGAETEIHIASTLIDATLSFDHGLDSLVRFVIHTDDEDLQGAHDRFHEGIERILSLADTEGVR